MNHWKHIFQTKEYLLLDGAFGTYLEDKGELLHSTLWSAGHLISSPEVINQIYQEYLTAGVDILTTASYQISYSQLLLSYQYSPEQTNKLLRYSTQLARNAILSNPFTSISHQKYIAGSIGCYGAHLANGSEYHGNYNLTSGQLFDWHKNKFQELALSDVDIIACETIPCLDEVKALIRLIDHCPQNILSWISIACQSSTTLNNGDLIEDYCRIIEDYEPMTSHQYTSIDSNLYNDGKNCDRIALGVNCTHPRYIEDIIHTFKDFSHKDRPIVTYPNRGDIWDDQQHCYCDATGCCDEEFARLALRWHLAGAKIIGGCCRTNPTTLQTTKQTLEQYYHHII